MTDPAPKKKSWRRIVLYALIGFVLGLGAIAAIVAERFQSVAHDYFVRTLRQRYHSDVVLDDLQISLFPEVRATGTNLVLWFHGDHTAPPVVKIRRFTLEAGFVSFFRSPKHIGRLTLEGLELHPPPRGSGHPLTGSDPSSSGKKQSGSIDFILDEVVANGSRLEITPKDPNKQPLVFDIRELTLRTVGKGQPMSFHAALTNPKPPGLIHADGRFGPWDVDSPIETPLSGSYTFTNADLGVFKGIAGTLSSKGQFSGPLDRIEVHGSADVPNFSLTSGERPVPLHTDFEATVDGSNGDTNLHPVHARLRGSSFDVSGSIDRGALDTHKTILLNAASGDNARIEDFLRLAIRGRPPMTGAIHFRTKVKIPPGQTDVIDRLDLDGDFSLSGVKFTSADVQGKLAGLSHRAQGDPENHDPDVASAFEGAFRLHNGTLGLPSLRFTLPGANITLKGTYAVRSGAIDLRGNARLDASVSQMTTGFFSKLLKPVDPLFRRDGAGAVIPFVVSGTRGDPSFKLNIGEFFKGIAK